MSQVNIANQDKEEWVENYARFGLLAKGVVYCLIGGLALTAAFGSGGQTGGRSAAFKEVLSQPFGQIMLGLIAIGLLGYSVWRFIQAFKDTEQKGDDAKGIIARIGFGISGLSYLAFTIYAATLIFGGSGGSGSGGSGGSGGGKEFIVAKLLQQPFGQWLVGIVAAIIIIKGIIQIWKGFTGKFKQDVNDYEVDRRIQNIYDKGGKIGYISRGVVFGIIGFFFVKAAIQSDASEAGGTSEVFSWLNSQGGPWLMGLIALGLVGYGVFMFVKARYRQMDPYG